MSELTETLSRTIYEAERNGNHWAAPWEQLPSFVKDQIRTYVGPGVPVLIELIEREVRAKVAEEIAQAITAQRRTGITAMLEGGWNHAVETMAGIAREHGAGRPESHGDATEAPPEGSAKGDAPSGPHSATQEGER